MYLLMHSNKMAPVLSSFRAKASGGSLPFYFLFVFLILSFLSFFSPLSFILPFLLHLLFIFSAPYSPFRFIFSYSFPFFVATVRQNTRGECNKCSLIFWDVMLSSLRNIYHCSGRTCCFHLQGRRVNHMGETVSSTVNGGQGLEL